jgi:hypothetical protein
VQGLATATSSNVVGTVTEADSGAWSVNAKGIPLSGDDPVIAGFPRWGENGNPTYQDFLDDWASDAATDPTSPWYGETLQDYLRWYAATDNQGWGPWAQDILNWLSNQGSALTPPLQSQEVQYTAGYNAQFSGVAGQQTFAKSMALSTANKIADQSNIKANTDIQFVAVDTGRATYSEDLLLDGASREQDSSSAILCPFANANPGIIPAFCNIEQAGSSFDSTLTSTVTSADTRFVGSDATIPTVLNYNINAQGITLGNQSSPMIGSVAAYLKVHVQEARNESVGLDTFEGAQETITLNPQKSEDLAYSEASTVSGLISRFSKSVSYSSQASAVPAPALIETDFIE